MNSQSPRTVVLQFIDRINAADVSGICDLMTEDHAFLDGLGNRVVGREKMRAGWRAYFAWFPDYRIAHEDMFENGDVVAVFGVAAATYAVDGTPAKDGRWEVPAAWKAVVRKGLISEWRVYCDNQPARRLLGEKVP